MTHLAHERVDRGRWPETVGTRLFAEGLAGVISTQIVSGLRLDEYLWFDDVHRTWLERCENRAQEIVDAVLANLDLDEERGDRFFSARPDGGGLPVRSGYWVGLRALQHLLDAPGLSVRDVLSWDAPTATSRLAEALGKTWPLG
jgi:hypothetical protein